MIPNYFGKIIEILFPPSCICCHKEGSPLCNSCVARLHRALDTPYIFIHSTFSFRDPKVKQIIHSIKYYHRKDLIIPLVNVVASEMRHSPINYTGVLIPIPMPKIRRWMRGYNQAEEITKILSSNLKLPMRTNILVRTRNAKRQVEASTRGARLLNQKNTFIVQGEVNNLDIILIDDVTTTGATILEARKVLLNHGASSVIAVTLAH